MLAYVGHCIEQIEVVMAAELTSPGSIPIRVVGRYRSAFRRDRDHQIPPLPEACTWSVSRTGSMGMEMLLPVEGGPC